MYLSSEKYLTRQYYSFFINFANQWQDYLRSEKNPVRFRLDC